MKKFKESDPDTLNTSELISDFHFYMQLIIEEIEPGFEYELT